MALSRSTRVNILIGNGHFLSHFYVICLPPMFLAWQDTFQVTFAQLGLITALMSATTAILQTPVGFLVDRYGARPFLVGGTLLMSLSVSAMSQATAYWQLPLLAILSGMGNSVVHPADYAILSGSVDKDKMGQAFALHTFNGNVGGAIAAQLGLELGANFLEGFGPRSLDAIQLDDVVTELGFDRATQLPFLHREDGIGERPHERVALRPTEIATLRSRPRIF